MTEEVNQSAELVSIQPKDMNEVPENEVLESENKEEQQAETSDEPPLPEPDEDYVDEADTTIDEAKKNSAIAKRKEKQLQRERERAAQLEAELDRTRQQTQVQAQQPYNYSFDVKQPTRDQFESEDEYFDARMDYRDAMRQAREHQAQQQAAMQKIIDNRTKKIVEAEEKGLEKYSDFDIVVKPIVNTIRYNEALVEAIAESPFKEDLFYYMGKYPDEAEKFAQMNAVKAVKELTKLELRFENSKKQKKQNPVHKPMQQIKGMSTGLNINAENLGKMSQSDFEKTYNSHFGKKKAW